MKIERNAEFDETTRLLTDELVEGMDYIRDGFENEDWEVKIDEDADNPITIIADGRRFQIQLVEIV